MHPYGAGFLSATAPLQTPAGHDAYAVAFASGGSTGQMKFVYRTEWEGSEVQCSAARALNCNYHDKGVSI